MSLSAADSLEILQLATRADNCASARDANGYALLFTEDARMTGRMGEVTGRAALASAVAEVWSHEPTGTLHLTLNPVIDEDAEQPTVQSVLLMIDPSPGAGVIGSAQVRQTVRLTDAGWRISSREIA
jgi:uncharacterized protein (TIGR02246 family)